jgi:hypothetical protein
LLPAAAAAPLSQAAAAAAPAAAAVDLQGVLMGGQADWAHALQTFLNAAAAAAAEAAVPGAAAEDQQQQQHIEQQVQLLLQQHTSQQQQFIQLLQQLHNQQQQQGAAPALDQQQLLDNAVNLIKVIARHLIVAVKVCPRFHWLHMHLCYSCRACISRSHGAQGLWGRSVYRICRLHSVC